MSSKDKGLVDVWRVYSPQTLYTKTRVFNANEEWTG
jgi:hypothetical protein